MKRTAAIVNKHCQDCAFAEVDTNPINRTAYDRKPFMIRCAFVQWKKFKNDTACERYVEREQPLNWNI